MKVQLLSQIYTGDIHHFQQRCPLTGQRRKRVGLQIKLNASSVENSPTTDTQKGTFSFKHQLCTVSNKKKKKKELALVWPLKTGLNPPIHTGWFVLRGQNEARWTPKRLNSNWFKWETAKTDKCAANQRRSTKVLCSWTVTKESRVCLNETRAGSGRLAAEERRTERWNCRLLSANLWLTPPDVCPAEASRYC